MTDDIPVCAECGTSRVQVGRARHYCDECGPGVEIDHRERRQVGDTRHGLPKRLTELDADAIGGTPTPGED